MTLKLPRSTGFNLIELLIAISIVSLLAAIGTSTYSHHIVKARRLQAANTLSELAIAMEEYHIGHGSYANAGGEKFKAAGNRYYEFMVESAAEDDYVLAAIPRGARGEKDSTIRLNAKGEMS